MNSRKVRGDSLSIEEQGIAYDNRNHSLGLAALRGIAAIGVLVYHSLLITPLTGDGSSESRQVGVPEGTLLLEYVLLGLFNGPGLVVLFFVLSGCVLAMSLGRRKTFSAADLPGYWIRRGFRLYPLLILAATFGGILQWVVGPGTFPYGSEWANSHYDVPRNELGFAWLKNITGASHSLNSPAWSIRVELLVSFIFPLLYFITSKPSIAILGLAVSLLMMFGLPPRQHDYLQAHIYLFSFILGALVPRCGRQLADRFGDLRPAIRISTLMVAALAFMFARQLIEPLQLDSKLVVIVESLIATLVVALALFGKVPAFMLSGIVQQLGRISYGIYLFHLIVLFGLANLLFPIVPLALADKPLLTSLGLCILTLSLTLPLAWYLYDLVEAPLQKLGGRTATSIERWFGQEERSHEPLPTQVRR